MKEHLVEAPSQVIYLFQRLGVETNRSKRFLQIWEDQTQRKSACANMC